MAVPFDDGGYRLPIYVAADCPTTLTIQGRNTRDRLFFGSARIRGRTRRHITEPTEVEISLKPRRRNRLAIDLGVARAGDRHIARWALAVAERLSPVPERIDAVIVLDTSRSLDDSDLLAQLDAARGYVAQLDAMGVDARVQVLTFDREVRASLPSMLPAAEALAVLEDLRPTRANGSDLAAALQRARTWLDDSGRSGAPRRILLLGDLRLAHPLRPKDQRSLLERTGALVHIGVPGGWAEAPDPWLDHPWDSAARASGGLVWQHMGLSPEGTEEWIRPTRLLAPRVTADGIEDERLALRAPIEAGSGVSWIDLVDEPISRLEVEGWLWTEPISARARARRASGRRLAAIVAAAGGHEDLSDDALRDLALHGHAVSPWTSLIAVEPGAQPGPGAAPIPRPATEVADWTSDEFDLDEDESDAEPPPVENPASAMAWMREAVWQRWRDCGVGDHPVRISLTLTGVEIAAIDDSRVASATDGEAVRCMTDAVWDLELPSGFVAPREHWTVEIDPIPLDARAARGIDTRCWAAADVSIVRGSLRRAELLCGGLRSRRR